MHKCMLLRGQITTQVSSLIYNVKIVLTPPRIPYSYGRTRAYCGAGLTGLFFLTTGAVIKKNGKTLALLLLFFRFCVVFVY